MLYLTLLLAFILANIVYVIAFFTGSIWLGVRAEHYFLGGGRALFTLSIRGIRISTGLYLPAFSRIYTMVDGRKERLRNPWEFGEKPLLRRLAVTLCGPAALVVASILACILVSYTQEKTIIPRIEVNRLGIYPSVTAEIAGFRRGDRILKLNGEVYEDFYELIDPAVLESRDTYYTVLRDGKEINISLSTLPEGFTPDYKEELFISLLAPFTVLKAVPSTPAAEAGLEYGDKITHVNGQPIVKYYDILDAVNSDTTGSVTLTIERTLNDSTRTFKTNLTADSMVPGRNRIGIVPNEIYDTEPRHRTFTEAVSNGAHTAFSGAARQLKASYRILTGQLSAKREAHGPMKISAVSRNAATTVIIVSVCAMVLAFLNFLPLPRAAFWELIALGYEAITQRQFPYNTFKILRKLALALVITSMILILFFDIAWLFLRA